MVGECADDLSASFYGANVKGIKAVRISIQVTG
jgi:hypothetical protein